MSSGDIFFFRDRAGRAIAGGSPGDTISESQSHPSSSQHSSPDGTQSTGSPPGDGPLPGEVISQDERLFGDEFLIWVQEQGIDCHGSFLNAYDEDDAEEEYTSSTLGSSADDEETS